ncbi:hypothetical protein TURU_001808 [Turdus rufiventris]|nr:hypothetical protein TURU_001808 [Turdus rufiventris]
MEMWWTSIEVIKVYVEITPIRLLSVSLSVGSLIRFLKGTRQVLQSVRNAGPGFPLGLFGHGDLDKSRVSDHDKPIKEKLLAYAAVKALLRVHVKGKREFSMAPQRRLTYDADFKLKAINHAKQHGNGDAVREFNINESMVCKWQQQEDDLRLAKKTKVFAGIKQDGRD